MTKSIARRDLLTLLPALTIPFANSRPAKAEGNAHPVLINTADSIYQYRLLLERVRGDAFQQVASGTLQAVEACNLTLDQLRNAVEQLHQHLQGRPNWPELEKRFAILDKSLASAEGKRPDQERAEALRALPNTLEAIRELLRDVSKGCNDDPDGAIAALVDHLYSDIESQNESIDEVDKNSAQWSAWNSEISASYADCAAAMDEAATAITESAEGKSDWQTRARAALQSAQRALDRIRSVTQQAEAAPRVNQPVSQKGGNRSSGALSALDSLDRILTLASKSIAVRSTSVTVNIAYIIEGPEQQSQPESVNLSQDDKGLVGRVQQLVQQREPRFFSPGVWVQVINCIAVCWPIWVVYNSDSASDLENRTALIASALAFGLMPGTERHGDLKKKLQTIYLDTIKGRQT